MYIRVPLVHRRRLQEKTVAEKKAVDQEQIREMESSLEKFVVSHYSVTRFNEDFVLCSKFLEKYEQYCSAKGIEQQPIRRKDIEKHGPMQVRNTLRFLFGKQWKQDATNEVKENGPCSWMSCCRRSQPEDSTPEPSPGPLSLTRKVSRASVHRRRFRCLCSLEPS